MRKRILHRFYDSHGNRKPHFGVTVIDEDGLVLEQYNLKRAPKPTTKYDELRECGCGASGVDHLAWCTRQKKVTA